MKEEKKLNFDILFDSRGEVADQYGIRFKLPQDLADLYAKFGIDLKDANGDASWTLPMPTRLIIDTGGVIRYSKINADYTKRPEPLETLAALKSIIGA